MTAHCVLCLNVSGDKVDAAATLAGYSVCEPHADLGHWMLRGDGSPDIFATVQVMKRKHTGLTSL